ncbi:putative adhesin [Streptomyces vinaceus]|uniref:putative adhesin n=1 Tax=Streptomyces vinaceus TaxID=1960 RepID=UPI0035DCFBB6
MAGTYINAHGGREIFSGHTFVPEGRTLHFYTDHGTGLKTTSALAIASGVDLAPVETFRGLAVQVPNYTLSKLAPDEAQRSLAARSDSRHGDQGFLTMGLDGMPDRMGLCTGGRKCSPKWGHVCDGVFSATHGFQNEIHLLCCRVEVAAYTVRSLLGVPIPPRSSTGLGEEHDAVQAELIRMLKVLSGPGLSDKAALKKFLQLPEGSRATLMVYPAVRDRMERAWCTLADKPYSSPGFMDDLARAARAYREEEKAAHHRSEERRAVVGSLFSYTDDSDETTSPLPTVQARQFGDSVPLPPDFASARSWYDPLHGWLMTARQGSLARERELLNMYVHDTGTEFRCDPGPSATENLDLIRQFVDAVHSPSGTVAGLCSDSDQAPEADRIHAEIAAAYEYCLEMRSAHDQLLRVEEGWDSSRIEADRAEFHDALVRSCDEDQNFLMQVQLCWSLVQQYWNCVEVHLYALLTEYRDEMLDSDLSRFGGN